MLVRDRMSAHPVTIEPESSALSALGIMQYHHLRHLPVVDPTGRLVGILAERDLLLAASRHLHAGMEVSEVMSRDVVVVHPETPLAEAALLMANHHFGSLPVTDAEHTIVGILTESDIFRAFADLDARVKA
ncbi:CBS domain-containing protein [Candidatus Chloroploca sp. M-50]|uniref:CBS domain-containing protein n=1 Tax=Candidatus Chloroploca mongolica TaxID=2528176 RepID=A0ABS4D609_9CHLR|nr:CBS domain-containing protein [Candidatus Chloroploca mongolica]MBP1464863.1 CBS domain-containing protein [Candidatus Chloroploca mongolica]